MLKNLVVKVTGVSCFSTKKANFTILAYEFYPKVDLEPRNNKEEFLFSFFFLIVTYVWVKVVLM